MIWFNCSIFRYHSYYSAYKYLWNNSLFGVTESLTIFIKLTCKNHYQMWPFLTHSKTYMHSHQDIWTLYVLLMKTPRVLRVLSVSQSYSHQQFYFFQCRNAPVCIWKCRQALGAERTCCHSHKSLCWPSLRSIFSLTLHCLFPPSREHQFDRGNEAENKTFVKTF